MTTCPLPGDKVSDSGVAAGASIRSVSRGCKIPGGKQHFSTVALETFGGGNGCVILCACRAGEHKEHQQHKTDVLNIYKYKAALLYQDRPPYRENAKWRQTIFSGVTASVSSARLTFPLLFPIVLFSTAAGQRLRY